LAIDDPVWDRFFTVAPLTLVGTWEPDGAVDLAPKHLGGPAAWTNLFGFVCAPHHATYRNIQRDGTYGISYPRPDQILLASLAAAPRADDDSKPSLAALPTELGPALGVPLLEGAGVQLECELVKLVDDLDANSLVIGRIVGARVVAAALRDPDRDDADVIAGSPLLAFIAPDHFATIATANHFPFHAGWRR
jgi:flavin reductase (DIM6/NTAB) family NADH-FMN oxidoreductase RutF